MEYIYGLSAKHRSKHRQFIMSKKLKSIAFLEQKGSEKNIRDDHTLRNNRRIMKMFFKVESIAIQLTPNNFTH